MRNPTGVVVCTYINNDVGIRHRCMIVHAHYLHVHGTSASVSGILHHQESIFEYQSILKKRNKSAVSCVNMQQSGLESWGDLTTGGS